MGEIVGRNVGSGVVGAVGPGMATGARTGVEVGTREEFLVLFCDICTQNDGRKPIPAGLVVGRRRIVGLIVGLVVGGLRVGANVG